jgi:hypothetical protein
LPIDLVPSGRVARYFSLRSPGAVMKVQMLGWSHFPVMDIDSEQFGRHIAGRQVTIKGVVPALVSRDNRSVVGS